MIIRLSEVPAEGLLLKINQTDRKTADALRDVLAAHPFEVEVNIVPIKQGYELYGSITGTRELECSFCLSHFKKSFSEKFHDLYLRGKAMDKFGLSNISSDISVFPLRSLKLSLGHFLHEILVLATDFQILCQKNCHGLCHSCGSNLNYEKCSCRLKKSRGESPFSVLKELAVLKESSQERI